MLVGVGLGPGDPELLTLKAINTLKKSSKVYVPGRLAAEIVSPYAEASILEAPMTGDKKILTEFWEKEASKIAGEAEKGLVSFCVLGDPNFYSTFLRLREIFEKKFPHIKVTTIPGVSAITAFASRLNISIDSTFEVSPDIWSTGNAKIVLKAKRPREIAGELKKQGYTDFILAERLFLEDENITQEMPGESSYFSLLYALRRRKEPWNKVYFVGAGPGNPQLLTLRGKELLEQADLVLYAGSLVNPVLLEFSRGEKIDSYGLSLKNIVDIIESNIKAGKKVVRLHSGDPSLYGAVLEQIDALKARGIEAEIVPGVSSLFASAAALKTQLTLRGITETLIITRPSGVTLAKDALEELSRHDATLAIFLGAHKIREIMSRVKYPRETPAAVVYHASLEDEKILVGTVGDIADKVERAGIGKTAIILIGGIVAPKEYRRSHLYGGK